MRITVLLQNGGLMAIPDGGPLSTVGQKRGHKNMERTTGPKFNGRDFLRSLQRKGIAIIFMAAKKKHWNCCIKNLRAIIREFKLLECTVLRLDH